MSTITIVEYMSKAGSLAFTSQWKTISQDQINQFADATHDHQYIHVDAERAQQTPFRGTIAHGFLSLSLLSSFVEESMPKIEGAVMGINYGFEKVRFLLPVAVNSRLRGKFTLLDCTERNPGEYLSKYEVAVEIENAEKPALVAEWMILTIVEQ